MNTEEKKDWRNDKTSEKYKTYLKRRHSSMKKASRKRLERLNKETPEEYKSRSKSKIRSS